jgi:DinB family protein
MSVFSNRSVDPPEERARYAGAILDLLADQDPLAVLRQTPPAAAQAINGLTLDALRAPEAPGKWSIVQVLQHLADSDLVWGWRVRMILAHDRPHITGYDQDLWADRLSYADADPDEAISLLTILRRANLRLIDRATPADLKRVGVHSERGEESVEYLLRLYAGHDLLHLRQIERIRSSLSAGTS